MTDDFLLVRGAWHYLNHQCPTVDRTPSQGLCRIKFSYISPEVPVTNVFFFFFAIEKKKKPKKHLTNPVALQVVYDSEVCVDDYANPRSAFKLLRYIPSVRSFLACRQVKDLVAAKANPEIQAAPAHDIRHMSGINPKRLLPLPRV